MYRTLLRHIRRSTTAAASSGTVQIVSLKSLPQNPIYTIPIRSYAFTSAEEAAAERRRRKRRLRIEPPMWALRRDPPSHSQQGGNFNQQKGPPLPDSTSSLTGPRLNLHNRVQSLIRAGDLDSASAVARHAVFSNVRITVFTCNAIIAAMYRAGRYTDAINLFQYFFNQSNIIPNIVSYNNLILSHFGNGNVEEAIKVYHHILEAAPFSPSCFTYRNLTKGLIEAGQIDEAVDMLREMLNKGQGADSLVYNNIISGFLELGNLKKANEFFEELQEKCTVYDGVVSATFMDWYFKQGKKKEAMEAYKYLLSKQFKMVPATCNVILEVLVRHGMEEEAWALFSGMLDNHTPPTFQAVNSDTFNIMVNECFRLGKVPEAIEVFKSVGKAAKSRPFSMDVAGFNNMIARLCEVEMLEEAESYFVQLQSKSLSPDVTSYRTFIDAYIKSEKVDEALEKYRMVVVAGLRVIPSYANKWFGFLIEKGKVAECVPILMKMCEREPKPDVSTFEVVIRGLCEINELDGCCYVASQMMTYGIGVTPALKEFILHVFEKHGKLETIERIVDAKFPFHSPPQMPGQVGTPQQPPAWLVPLRAPPTEGHTSIFPSPQIKRDQPPVGPQMPWQAPVSPQMPRQVSVGATQTSWQASVSSQQPWQASTEPSQLQSQSSFNAQVPGASQDPWQSSVSPPIPGQGSAGATQIQWQASSTAQFPRATSQMGWQNSVSPQFQGQASKGAAQIQCQASANTQVPRASQMHWQAPSNAQVYRESQVPWQASSNAQAPGASQVPWQASSNAQVPRESQVSWQTSVSPQVPQHTYFPPHSPGQSAGPSQMSWQTPFSPQTPEQTAAGSQMPDQVITHQMAK